MRKERLEYDLVVCGGGLAGLCAAVAAARHGARTALVHDRPVLGGNSSSEVRVTPHGAARFHAYARETGILSEAMAEDRAINHEQFVNNGWTNSLWDLTLYSLAVRTPGLSLYLNTTIFSVKMDASGRTIEAVVGRVGAAETELEFWAKTFVDCTGDGIVAALAGNEWRMGTESRHEFGEPHAPERASGETMGSTIHFRAKDTGRPVPYRAPEWAAVYDDPAFFYAHNRKPYDIRAGYWWIELSAPWDTIRDAELIRHELTRHVFGIWDWIKNKDPNTKKLASTYALDWIGQVPGKRESRRIVGRYLMTEHDPLRGTVFPDEVAFGGWYVDLHVAGGLLAPTSELPGASEICGPYGIPLRILIAKDIDNLLMAGRNVSVTHAALGTVRVMATTALMGQAAGTAAAVALRRGIAVPDVPELAIGEVQQLLLRDGCFLPNVEHRDEKDLARKAVLSASSEQLSDGSGEPDGSESVSLHVRRSQWIATKGELRSLKVYLSNDSGIEWTVMAELVPVGHIWDYRTPKDLPPLRRGEFIVPPGYTGWIEWPVDVSADERRTEGYVRLDLTSSSSVRWHLSERLAPGQPSAYEIDSGKLRSRDDGRSFAFRVEPAQSVYSAASAASGASRPYRAANMWRSDPELPVSEQWLELAWNEPVTVGVVELTFPGHLLQDYNRYPAFFREPECPGEYAIEIWEEGKWREALRVNDQYQRHVRHVLPKKARTNRLRVSFLAINGSPSAVVHEIRCYSEN
ncbi:FAD-dependent oxidoreductase [Cohnella sp. AR92]|uniref:FAD-dependent oxidoreductase n=1 Tax=Cohnella sp. AR92 TaxID=648716 RepID=UPI000F8D63BD|nr:FAD-dependent oxidoreductase [Cohnella sp. AR92]RUS48530.1 FAD-dependent oxidoreductase [Cohnella sp. AR92]